MATIGRETTVQEAADVLCEFSFDKTDIKPLWENYPSIEEKERVAFEYELQLLKIISVGWGLSYITGKSAFKENLADLFWKRIKDTASSLSQIAASTMGKEVDYFQAITERFEFYINVISGASETQTPGSVISQAFAAICKKEDDPYTVIAAKRVFNMSLTGVTAYMESVEIR